MCGRAGARDPGCSGASTLTKATGSTVSVSTSAIERMTTTARVITVSVVA